MSFKIVQTIENGQPKLTVVPTLWEVKGIVYWPPKNIKNSWRLIKDPNSCPGPEWASYKCALKRNYIPTYEEANKELSAMEENTDTDIASDSCSVQQTSKSKPDQASDGLIDFESMAQKLDNLLPSNSNSCTLQVFSSEEIQNVSSKLDLILDNQKKIALKVAALSVQIEEMNTSLLMERDRPVNVTLLQDQLRTEENGSFSIIQIKNKQELETLEMLLLDKIEKKKYFKTLSLLCSTSVGSGTTCAYKLLDILFSREFLCECSWSGSSKGEVSKIPLKNYKNIRKFFFEMVHSWDQNFTDDDTEKFLKLVVRNAKKRKAMKGLRQSTKRSRNNNATKNPGNVVGIDEKSDNEEMDLC